MGLEKEELKKNKGKPGGYPPLGVDGKVPSAYLPTAGGGDMYKSTYDPDADSKIANAQLTSGIDIADAITKKHANTLDHSNSLDHSNALDHNGGTQDTAIAGKEPANANIQTHVTSAHAPSNAQKNSDIIIGEIEAKLTGVISSHSHSGGSSPSWYGVLYSNQNDCNPNEVFREWNMLAVAGPTPTDITVSLARAVMFTPPANMTCIKVRLFGIGITTSLYKFAIYPVGTGSAKLWDSGTVTTAANTWLNVVTNFALVAGTKYWFCVTAVATGTTAGFRSMPAPLGTTFWGANVAPIGNRNLSIPVFVQFAVSTGVFPATLPAIAAAAYSNGTTGTVPFALLDSIS